MTNQRSGLDLKINLENPYLSAEIYPNLGGLCSSLKLKNIKNINHQPRELLAWPDGFDPHNYNKISGGLPLLFPICGRLSREKKIGQYLYDHQIFNLGIHGFLYKLSFEILEIYPDKLILKIQDNPETRVQYPFRFEICLTYFLDKNKLVCEQVYKNLDQKPMPFYAGFHPYFKINKNGTGATLSFKARRSFQYNSELSDVIGEQDCLSMPIDLADPEQAYNERLSELEPEDLKTILKLQDGLVLSQEAQGFPYLQLYGNLDRAFICLEPWMSHPNSFNSLLACPILKPGESMTGRYELSAFN